ncbi:transmembrane emp24 domain-containing protein 7-like [Liolophura sinensis]|uniref:transmembrane emp24 domain-containing protein 7-like n=1 Tax=Liolophura sinensis TaxID=3198878 RepID=UPI0031593DF2
MESAFTLITLLVVFVAHVLCGELTFELPDNERECFFEHIEKGIQCTLEFQVITGGNYDVDMDLSGPNGQILYKDMKKQYDTFTWTTDQTGVYKFCFSNEFSTFTHKVVYFDFQAGDDPPLVPEMAGRDTAMTQMEMASQSIHEALTKVLDYGTHFRLREAQGRVFAEDLNERVMIWSIGESIIILLIGIGQVLVLRSFFTDKRSQPVKT